MQEELIKAVVAVNPRTVVVLIHGGPLAIEWTSENVPAIVDAHYAGQLGGDAIANVLLGTVPPSGRLTTTMYPQSFVHERPITSTDLHEGKGVTYRYYSGQPIYPFGHGLSYSTFELSTSSDSTAPAQPLPDSQPSQPQPMPQDTAVTTSSLASAFASYDHSSSPMAFDITVANTGTVDSDFVLLLFLTGVTDGADGVDDSTGHAASGAPAAPLSYIKKLVGYERTHVPAGKQTMVHVAAAVQPLATVDASGAQTFLPGTYTFEYGVDGAAEGRAHTITRKVTGSAITVFNLTAAIGP
jgi:hypothetical protein